MIEIVQNSDYKDFLNLLIEQYKNKPKFKGILESIADEFNDLEGAIFEVRDEFWLTTAIGDQLDVIGMKVGESRLGRNDADYRTAIQNKIIINNGSGEPELIIFAMKNAHGATSVHIIFVGIATIDLWVDVPITLTQFNDIVKIIPSGVALELKVGSDTPFVFYDDPDGLGFGGLLETQLYDTNGDAILDTNGDNIYVTHNSSDLDEGGELQGVWTT